MFARKPLKHSYAKTALASELEHPVVIPAHFFNGRLVAFICLLVLIALLFVTPATNYFSQQVEISRQEEALRKVRQENKELAGLRERQRDEEYVKQQARQRLRMAVPGETPYIVVGQVPESERHSETSAQDEKITGESLSWPRKVFDSIVRNARDH